MMKDREQNLGLPVKIGRGLAAVGLFISGCNSPVSPSEVYKSYQTNNYRVDKFGDHTYRVWGTGTFNFQYIPNRDEGIKRLKVNCTVESIIFPEGEKSLIVIVKEPNCYEPTK